MANREDHPLSEARPAAPAEAPDHSSASNDRADQSSQDKVPRGQEGRDHPTALAPQPGEGATAEEKPKTPPAHPRRKWFLLGAGVIVLAGAAYFIVPWLITALNTVSTDDAYVNGHVTFVAPRVLGQVTKVLVDDNYHVKKGTCWSSSTRSRTRCKSRSRKPPVVSAEADLVAAQAQVQGLVAPGPEQPLQARARHRGRQTTRSPICAPLWRPLKAGRRPWSWHRPTSNGARSSAPAGASARKTSTSAGRPSRSMKPPSSKPCSPSTRFGSALASLPASSRPRPDRSAARPRSELLHRPPGAGRPAAKCGPVRLLPDVVERDPETGHCRFLQAGPQGQPRPHLRPHHSQRAGHQTGRGQAPPGQAATWTRPS